MDDGIPVGDPTVLPVVRSYGGRVVVFLVDGVSGRWLPDTKVEPLLDSSTSSPVDFFQNATTSPPGF